MARRRVKNSSSKPDDPLLLLEPPVVQTRGTKEYALPCALVIFILLGGSMLGWFCSQQQQAIEDLTEALATMQNRITKLQQQLGSGSAQLASVGGFEERLLALEEAYAKAQRQAEVALAASEQIKSKDLQNKVWTLQTEMNAKFADLQQNSISIASLNAIIKNKSDEFEALKQSVNTILSANTELAVSVSGFTSTLSLTESRLGEHGSIVDGLKSQLEDQKRELDDMKEFFTSNQDALVTNVQELMELRQQMELQHVKRSHAFKEQLKSLHKKLEDHQTSTESLHSLLTAKLEDIQTQILPGAEREDVQDEMEKEADKADDEEQAETTVDNQKTPNVEPQPEHPEEKKLAVQPEAGEENKVTEEYKVTEENKMIKKQGTIENKEFAEEQEANQEEEDDVPTDKRSKRNEKVTEIQGAEVEENVTKEVETKEKEELAEKQGVSEAPAEEKHQTIPQEVEDRENEEHEKKHNTEKIQTSLMVSDLTKNQTKDTDLTQTGRDEQTEETAGGETEMDTTAEIDQSLLEETKAETTETEETFAEKQVKEKAAIESLSLLNDQHTEKTKIENNDAEEQDSEAAAEDNNAASDEADSGPNGAETIIVETSEKQEGESVQAEAEIKPEPVKDLPEDSTKE